MGIREQFEFGDLCRVSISEEANQSSKIKKNQLSLQSQNISEVFIVRYEGNDSYCIAPIREKKKKGSVRVVISKRVLYVRVQNLIRVHGDLLIKAHDMAIENRDIAIAEIRRVLKLHKPNIILGDKKTEYNLEKDPILSVQIRYCADNVVCPKCRKLLPSADKLVHISDIGTIILRVGLCLKCKTYYTFNDKLMKKNGRCNQHPVVWSDLRYRGGTEGNIRFKRINTELKSSINPHVVFSDNHPKDSQTKHQEEENKRVDWSLFGVLFKQIPLAGVHDRGCPMCKRTAEDMVTMKYAAYRRDGLNEKRFSNVFYCKHCDFAYATSELKRMMEDDNPGYKIYTIDTQKHTSVKEITDIAIQDPITSPVSKLTVKLPFEFSSSEIPNLSKESNAVFIYAQKCSCRKCFNKYGIMTIKNRTAVVESVSGKTVEVNVMFCMGCGRYYMNQKSFETYSKLYGGLLFEFMLTGELAKSCKMFANFAPNSILSRCGYSVQQGIPKEYRQARLAYILDSGKAQKYEIVNLITNFIGLREYDPRYFCACERWKEDLFFVNHYQIKKQEKVYNLKFFKIK